DRLTIRELGVIVDNWMAIRGRTFLRQGHLFLCYLAPIPLSALRLHVERAEESATELSDGLSFGVAHCVHEERAFVLHIERVSLILWWHRRRRRRGRRRHGRQTGAVLADE